MEKYFIIIMVIFFNYGLLFSQEIIDLNKGTSIVVDGKITPGEWDDAQSVNLQSSGNKIVRILFKNDGENLLFAFLDNLGSANFRFPEIFLDINNDKSPSWMNDDWWFHVSATNCFNKGAHSVYNTNTCKTVQPNWQANNFSVSLPDTVEIKIPFSTVDLDTNISSIGMAFDVTDTYSAWEFYPAGADIDAPDSWLTANLNFNNSQVEDEIKNQKYLNIFPNPFSHSVTIQYILKQFADVRLAIFDIQGNKIKNIINSKQDVGGYFYKFEANNLPSGIYFYLFSIDGIILESGKLNYIE